MWHLCFSFFKLSKGGTEIVQACDNCFMPGFCRRIVLAFISGVELFDYRGYDLMNGGIKLSGPNAIVNSHQKG